MIRIVYPVGSAKISGTEKSLLFILDNSEDEILPIIILQEFGLLVQELQKRNIRYFILRKTFKFDPIYLFRLFLLYKKIRPDIVHHHSSRIDVIPARILGIKTVERNNMSRERDGLFLNKISYIDYLTSKLIDKFICVSNDLRNVLINRGIPESKITVIKNGVDPTEFYEKKLSKQNEVPVIGIFGRLHIQKGHLYFIEALHILRKRGRNIKAIIVGEGSLSEKLKNITKKYNLTSLVEFLGFQKDMNLFYNLCDIIVVPSIWEPLPNVILEAMMVGKPIIASNVGGIPELIKNEQNGILVEPKNSIEIADAIEKLLNNKQLIVKLGKNAKIFAKGNLLLDKMTENTILLYKELINKK